MQAATSNPVKFPAFLPISRPASRSLGLAHLPGEHLDDGRRRLDPLLGVGSQDLQRLHVRRDG